MAKEELERSLVSQRERLAIAKKAGPEKFEPSSDFKHLAQAKGEQIAMLERTLKGDEESLAMFANPRFLVPPWLGGDWGNDEIKVGSIGRCPASAKLVDTPDKQTLLVEVSGASKGLVLLTGIDDVRRSQWKGSGVFECTAIEERNTPRGIRRVSIMRPFSLVPYVE